METVHLSSTTVHSNKSNAAEDAFDWNTPEGHQSLTQTSFTVVDIPEASAKSKRKVEHSTSSDLSTSIDTAELDELTPTGVQPPRSSKKQKTQPRRKVIIAYESDDESSESLAF
ncbi:hypothetical protein V6N13_024854 [Hibiscus sabdariffa]